MDLGKQLRKRRLIQGYGLRELSGLLDISPTYLSKIERGMLPPPSSEILLKMAKHLELDGDVLLLKAGRLPAWMDRLLRAAPINCINALRAL